MGKGFPVSFRRIIMTIQSHVSAYKKGAALQAHAIAELTKTLKRKTRESVRAELIPCIAKAWGVPLVEGERKAQGTMVFDSTHSEYENAKKALYTLVTAIKGKASSSSTEEVTFTRVQLKQAKSFLAMFESKAQAIKALHEITAE